MKFLKSYKSLKLLLSLVLTISIGCISPDSFDLQSIVGSTTSDIQNEKFRVSNVQIKLKYQGSIVLGFTLDSSKSPQKSILSTQLSDYKEDSSTQDVVFIHFSSLRSCKFEQQKDQDNQPITTELYNREHKKSFFLQFNFKTPVADKESDSSDFKASMENSCQSTIKEISDWSVDLKKKAKVLRDAQDKKFQTDTNLKKLRDKNSRQKSKEEAIGGSRIKTANKKEEILARIQGTKKSLEEKKSALKNLHKKILDINSRVGELDQRGNQSQNILLKNQMRVSQLTGDANTVKQGKLYRSTDDMPPETENPDETLAASDARNKASHYMNMKKADLREKKLEESKLDAQIVDSSSKYNSKEAEIAKSKATIEKLKQDLTGVKKKGNNDKLNLARREVGVLSKECQDKMNKKTALQDLIANLKSQILILTRQKYDVLTNIDNCIEYDNVKRKKYTKKIKEGFDQFRKCFKAFDPFTDQSMNLAYEKSLEPLNHVMAWKPSQYNLYSLIFNTQKPEYCQSILAEEKLKKKSKKKGKESDEDSDEKEDNSDKKDDSQNGVIYKENEKDGDGLDDDDLDD